MLTILIVLPILMILMFTLGLTLEVKDFLLLKERPKDLLTGLSGQLLLLPVLAIIVGTVFSLPPVYFIGLLLIACCPGGSSSNIFSLLAKGDVALSVSLTALSSVLTLATMPLILSFAMQHLSFSDHAEINLPVGNLLLQNLVTMLLPVLLGIMVKRFWSDTAQKLEAVLSKFAFPALIILAGIFFFQNREQIAGNLDVLGVCVTTLLLCSVLMASFLSRMLKCTSKVRRTLVIEVGMQNAAQAIALASSPLVFNNSLIAVPAIIYALMMNIILLIYLLPFQIKKDSTVQNG